MKKIDIGQTINTHANIGVIAGIIILAIEIRASTTATQAASIQMATALDQEHLLLVGAEADLARIWQTYLRDPETLTEDEQRQGAYLLAAALRRLENVWLLDRMGALSDDSWESRLYLLRQIAGSPGYAMFLESAIAPGTNQDFLRYIESIEQPVARP